MLGMELHWSHEKVKLTQTCLIKSLVKQRLKEDGGRCSLPSNPDAYQKADETDPKIETKKYQAIIGGLLFITRMSRPEISVHVNLLGRRTKDVTDKHLKTVLQVLRYLHLTKDEGITLCKANDLNLTIYTDAVYGGENLCSQTGAIMCLGNQLVGWYSRRQDVVSLSVTEAETLWIARVRSMRLGPSSSCRRLELGYQPYPH